MGPPPPDDHAKKEYDVFLSYADHDTKVAKSIAEQLRKEGLRAWFEGSTTDPHQVPHREFLAALDSSASCLVLISDALSHPSPGLSTELSAIQARSWTAPDFKLLPVQIDESAPTPPFLRQWRQLKYGEEGGLESIGQFVKTALQSDAERLKHDYDSLFSTQLKLRFDELRSETERLKAASDD